MDYVPDIYIIHLEKRLDKKISYLGYTKKELFTKLQNFIVKNDNEKVLYLMIDIIVSQYFDDLWNSLFYISSKYIHIYNPYITEYLLCKKHDFDGIILKTIKWRQRKKAVQLYTTSFFQSFGKKVM